MKTGDKVVCVDDSKCRCGCNRAVPVSRGIVYVVERIYDFTHPKFKHCHILVLIGVCAAPGHARGILADRFRLLSELKAESAAKKSNVVAV